jgi:hypothetical protein
MTSAMIGAIFIIFVLSGAALALVALTLMAARRVWQSGWHPFLWYPIRQARTSMLLFKRRTALGQSVRPNTAIARLGNLLYRASCGIAALIAFVGLVLSKNEPVFERTFYLVPRNTVDVIIIGGFLVFAGLVWLFGLACRYILSGPQHSLPRIAKEMSKPIRTADPQISSLMQFAADPEAPAREIEAIAGWMRICFFGTFAFLILFLIWPQFDRMRGEVTIYRAFCKTQRVQGTCKFDNEETANPQSFKAYPDQQSVIYWIGDSAPTKYSNCAVRNTINWHCTIGPRMEYSMVDGIYVETLDFPFTPSTDLFYQVPRWRWWLLEVKESLSSKQ